MRPWRCLMSSWRVRCPLSSHMLLTLSASSWRYDLIVWILFDILNFIHFFKLTSDVWYLNAQRVLHVLSACVRSAVTPIWVTLCEWKRSLASPSSSSWRVRWVIHQLFKYLPYVCVCVYVCGVVEHMRILWVCQKTWLLVLSFLDTKRSVYHW